MATGDLTDMQSRLKGQLPPSWFGSGDVPVLDTVLSGIAQPLAWAYSLYEYVLQQARISTSTGGWLDLTAWDYFGSRFRRRLSEGDTSFRSRILSEILRERATRAGVARAVRELTGTEPVIIELWNPGDCGGYDTTACGYDMAGYLGSYDYSCQMLITAFRPNGEGIPDVAGYDTNAGGYDSAGPIEYIDPAWTVGPVTDPEIYAAVAQTIAAGTIGWVRIASAPIPLPDLTGWSMDFSQSQNAAALAAING